MARKSESRVVGAALLLTQVETMLETCAGTGHSPSKDVLADLAAKVAEARDTLVRTIAAAASILEAGVDDHR